MLQSQVEVTLSPLVAQHDGAFRCVNFGQFEPEIGYLVAYLETHDASAGFDNPRPARIDSLQTYRIPPHVGLNRFPQC